jgi:CubicO group peptidase (beta-lactamase class C family)
VVAAVLVDGTPECAGFGTLAAEPEPACLRWEVGSITKVFTGILLAEMSRRGEVGLDDPIGLHLPAGVTRRLPDLPRQPTLADLAAHTSGLPRLPRQWLRRIGKSDDPYSLLTEQDVWDALGPAATRPSRPRPRYSNFGAGLLGHLLGRAAGEGYQDLISRRILEPLGLESTGFGPEPVVPGFRGRRPTPPWTFGALHGAGALRSTAADMIAFVAACIDPPPGTLGEALRLAQQPRVGRRRHAVGLGWQIRLSSGDGGSPILWHNGGTYGGAAFLAVDTSRRVAVVAFGNRGPRLTSPLDRASWKLLRELLD